MISSLVSLYRPRFVKTIVYMLQNTEYQAGPYLVWFWRTTNFSRVMYRRQLVRTRAAKLLLTALSVGIIVELLVGVGLIGLWQTGHLVAGWAFGLAVLIAYPMVWAHLVVVPLALGRWLIVVPKNRRLIKKSEHIFSESKATKIAIAGSYGKTSMKELLFTVLSEGKMVAATEGNKNVSVSHAHFAARLTGKEDILLIEYGEGAPGDVRRFSEITHPDYAVITGLAPAHLDKYKTLKAAGKDIFSVTSFVEPSRVYVNGDSAETGPFRSSAFNSYDSHGVLGWKTKNVVLSLAGTEFDLVKGKRRLHITSGLLGKQQVGPLSLAAVLGLVLGLTEQQVADAIAKTIPFEHRMQPTKMGGADVIDDTYNGNIEGIKAGTELLKELKAKRKIYVTPGLVDQGRETKRVHLQMGELIAAANPDIVVLMKNSVSGFIKHGLDASGYAGEIKIVDDPLKYYTELPYFVAAGDLVLMQNDWPDNYA